jgi:hypothetical protein
MAVRTVSRRKQTRYDVSSSGNATVEFSFPRPGLAPLRFALVDIGLSGIRFAYGDELAGMEVGTTLGEVTLRVGSCEMQGELVVMHITPVSEAIAHCGALFYPASDEELTKLKGVVAGLSLLHQD